jgi:uncharacterized protein (DUF433 family)
MDIKTLITIDPEILEGQAVFKGTRVSIESLFDFLEAGYSIDTFVENFPSVRKEQAIALLDAANKLFTLKNIEQLYASVA